MKISNEMEQLLHFRFGPIWDGNLISKSARDHLDQAGYIERVYGFGFLTAKGIRLLLDLGYLNQDTWRLSTDKDILVEHLIKLSTHNCGGDGTCHKCLAQQALKKAGYLPGGEKDE